MKSLFKNNYFVSVYLIFLGGVSSFSLPPYNYFVINFFTFSLFFIFIFINKKSNYFYYGWLFGFGYFFSSLYWISIALTFDSSFKILIPFSLILIPSTLAIFYGLALYIFSFFIKDKIFFSVLIFSVIFGLVEFVRGNIFTGFPWNLFVFSFSNNLEFIQILSIIGTYGLNMICITLFLIPSIFILKKTNRDIFLSLFFISLGLFFLLYGAYKLNSQNSNSVKNNYTIKIISPKIEINRFYSEQNEKEIINDLIKLSDPNPKTPTVFIWPEAVFTSTYLKDIDLYKEIFSKNFSEKHLIILGVNDLNYEDNISRLFNSLVVVNRNLDVLKLYHKTKLVPFGEFLPLEKFLINKGFRSVSHGYKSFSAGHTRKSIKIENEYFNLNFLPLICYEIIYSGNLNKDNKYDFILNISEDGWFGNSVGPYQHFAHSIFRSIEEGKSIFRSTNNGISGYVDINGRIKTNTESTLGSVLEINEFTRGKTTIFFEYGNKIFFYLVVIYIILIFFLNRKRSL